MQRALYGSLVAACLGLLAIPALAGPHEHSGSQGGGYAARGSVVGRIPHGGYEVRHGGGRYWYQGGNWYGPRGMGWMVIAPPFGAFVPMLPGYYSTYWFGGAPYYYANDVYYLWRSERNAYEVVPPPEPADGAVAAAPVDLYIYPRNGQTEAQQSEDRYQCHRWATDQTHFDPTRPGGGFSGSPEAGRADYFRAMTACLEGRGYTAK
ncbi:MAG: DUF6515 family protein [Pseudomonadota bacterium]|jgi:hypothetical protein